MTDRELLELAAKAAGIEGFWVDGFSYRVETPSGHYFWNPLTDDGEALRLAVKLGMWMPSGMDPFQKEPDPYAATRRAIVRAAAQIGKGMK